MVGRPLVDRGVGDGVARSAILSTFPPTACGIATFSAALAAGLIANGATVDVVRCGEPEDVEDPLVVATTAVRDRTDRSPRPMRSTTSTSPSCNTSTASTVAVDGADVIDVLEALACRPSSSPTPCCANRRRTSARCSSASAARRTRSSS